MEALLVLVGGVLALLVGMLYQWVVGPAEHEKGAADERALQQARFDSLKTGIEAVNKLTEAAAKKDIERGAEAKAQDPVDFANSIIEKGKKS